MKKYTLVFVFLFVSIGIAAQSQSALKRFPFDSTRFVQIAKQLTTLNDSEKSSKIASIHDYLLLDSIKYGYNSNYVSSFDYNSFGDITEERFIYSSYPTSWWRSIYKYNSNNKITEILTYHGYDTTTNSWIPEAKVHYAYYSNGLLKRSVWWFYYKDYNQWGKQYGEFLYYYDSKNRLIKKQLNFNTTGTMKPDAKTLYHYNQDDDLGLYRNYHWHGNSWILRKKKTTNFFSSGLFDWKEELNYDENTGSFKEGYREVYYRDSKDSIIESKVFWYNPTTMQLGSQWRQRTLYNKFSKPLKIYQKSDTVTYVRRDYTYDGFGNLMSYKRYSKESYYNLDMGAWRDTVLLIDYKVYLYDYNHEIDEVIYPKYFLFGTNLNLGASFLQILYQGSTWVYFNNANNPPIASNQFSLYYYSKKTIVGIDDIQNARIIKVYPNPAHAYIRIEGLTNKHAYSFSIYDIQGKLILETNLSNSSKINIQTLKSGLYIYKVYDEANIYTGKLIVE